MINANKEILNSFFTSNLQYVIPFFQRSYVWQEENWEILWENIEEISSIKEGKVKGEHFIGTLITKQQLSEHIGETKLDLIDGQQRLTTISLLLKGIAYTAKGDGEYKKLKDKVNELVVFEDSKGNKFLRIEHSKNDKEYFEAVMFDKELSRLSNQDHKLIKCYKYFLDMLKNFTDEQLDNLKTVILNNVPVISMLLAVNDDEQEIFDTINSLGVKLTTGELLKNYIFKEKEIQNLYESLWFTIFEEEEEQIKFWNKNKTSGRIIRTNIEVLLYCYLIIKTRKEVKLEKLFNEYKNWLHGKSNAEKKQFLNELKNYTTIYYNFPQEITLNEISFSQDEERFFHIIENLEITTVYPLVLYIYKQVTDIGTRKQLLKALESYIVRRNVCRLTTKNYNNLFMQIIGKLIDSDNVTCLIFKDVLTSFTEDTNRFPSDEEFKSAFSEESLSNHNAREILYIISLYQIKNSKQDVKKLSSSSFTIEHIMPQKWEINWKKNEMNENDKINRNKKIKTLGNLTLVTKSLNSSLKNSAWENKRKELKKFSSLNLTTDYLENSIWDESCIEKRAEDLSKLALMIWQK